MKKNKENSNNENPKLFNRVELKESLNIADLPNYLEKITKNIESIEKRMSKKELNTNIVSDFLQKKPKEIKESKETNLNYRNHSPNKKVSFSPSKVDDINDIVKKSIIGVNEVLKKKIVKQYEDKFDSDIPSFDNEFGISKTVENINKEEKLFKKPLIKKNIRVNNIKKGKKIFNKSAIVDRPNSSFDMYSNDITQDKDVDKEKDKDIDKSNDINKKEHNLHNFDKIATEPVQNKKIVKKINYYDKPKSSRGRLSDYHKCAIAYKNNNQMFTKEGVSPLNKNKEIRMIDNDKEKDNKLALNNKKYEKINISKIEKPTRQSRSQLPSRNNHSVSKLATINTEEAEKKISEMIPFLDNDLIIEELPNMEDKITEKKIFRRISTPVNCFDNSNNEILPSQLHKNNHNNKKGSINHNNQFVRNNHTPNNYNKIQINPNENKITDAKPTSKRYSIQASKNVSKSRDATQNNSTSKSKNKSSKISMNNKRAKPSKIEGGEIVENTKKNLKKLFEKEGKREYPEKPNKEDKNDNKNVIMDKANIDYKTENLNHNNESTEKEKEDGLNNIKKLPKEGQEKPQLHKENLRSNKEMDNIYKVNFPENIETKDIFSLMLLWNELILSNYSKKFSNSNKKIISNYSNLLSKFILSSFSNEDKNKIKVKTDENRSASIIQKFWRKYKMKNLAKNKSIKSEIRKTIFSKIAEKEGFQLNKINLLFNSALFTYGEMKNKDEFIQNLIENNNEYISSQNQQNLFKDYITYSLQQQNQNFVIEKKDKKK